jgi:hypothetical protein
MMAKGLLTFCVVSLANFSPPSELNVMLTTGSLVCWLLVCCALVS